MAISRIGTGWPVEDRDFATIALWNTARGGSGELEEGILRGSVTTGNTTINGAFSSGALLHGFVEYDGSNLSEIATTGGNHFVNISSSNVIIRDLSVIRAQNFAFPVTIDGNDSFFERCYLRQNGTGNAGTVNLGGTATNKGIRHCVVIGNNNANFIQTGTNRDFTIASCVGVGYPAGSVTVVSSGAVTVLRDSFFVENTGETYGDPSGYNVFLNNASADGTGTVTGYTTAEFVDFANEDYRIKSTSDLFAFGIGAFFEEGGGAVESTVAATWPLFQTQASQSSTAPDITSDIAAHWPVFGVSVSQGAQVPDIDSTIAAAWPLFSVQVNQELELPQYQATIAATWPMLSASVSQQSEVPQYSSDLAVTWPLFNVSVEQESQAPAIEITAAVTWPLFSIAANQESQLPEGATSIAVTWPLFGVDASQQSTVPEFDSTIAAAWPLFQVSASQQQELPSGATAVAIEWPMFGVQTSQESTIPEFTATVAAAWPLFSVSILAGEFEFFASPQARVDIPNLSRRVDIPSLSRRIDI